MYDFKFYEEAEKDLTKLNNSIKKLFVKKLSQILNNPEIGKDLGNKNNLELAGLKKVYFDNKRYRIVYEVKEKEILIHIIAVGKRDNMKVYKQAHKRVEKHNKT
ncbi:RelE/StbE replicon stabilization toxin [hydrothermal vent metagenome]|uniref:RelE/StbE replicon stabilization toxin n=1 Tax=hydrothermal vent metagenome TaxID=652676 RepID=A0A1W1BA25_9ZZZZ